MAIDSNSLFVDDTHFEAEVRRIAKILWPTGSLDRSPKIDGMERDAVVTTRDLIIIIEATTSRKMEKISDDAKKTADAVKKIRSQNFACKGILVTLNEPTSEQEEKVKQHKGVLELESFQEFLARMFDASQYLTSRQSKPFGSIRNPKDGKFDLERDFYVAIPIVDEAANRNLTVEEIAEEIRKSAGRFAVLADFGSGKSMSLREVFFQLRESFFARKHLRFPIYINLRDHTGAKYPDEILERHARDLGLSNHSELVNAWRSGLVDLILDGFDELAATGWSSNAFKLRQIRRTMLEAVRKLISESRKEVGIIIAGRHHYFDSVREMR